MVMYGYVWSWSFIIMVDVWLSRVLYGHKIARTDLKPMSQTYQLLAPCVVVHSFRNKECFDNVCSRGATSQFLDFISFSHFNFNPD